MDQSTNLPPRGKWYEHGNIVKLTHGNTYYEYIKPENPRGTVVLVHGMSWWSFTFDDIVEPILKAEFACLKFDLYGRGQSDSVPLPNNDTLFVEQLHELLNTVVGKEEKIILLGTSLGGAISAIFTSKYPERVKKLILLGPGGIQVPFPAIVSVLTFPYLGKSIFYFFGQSAMLSTLKVERCKNDFYQSGNPKIESLKDQLVQKLAWQIEHKEGFPESFRSTLQNFPLSGSENQIKLIPQTLPILLLWGTEDIVTPFSAHAKWEELLPHIKFVPISNAGHSIHLEEHEQVVKNIIEFLQN